MPGAGRCEECDAVVASESERCVSCGAPQFPADPAQVRAGPPPADPFKRIRRDPAFAGAVAAPPFDTALDPVVHAPRAAFSRTVTVLALLALGVGLWLRAGRDRHEDVPDPFLLIALGISLLAAVSWLRARGQSRRLAMAVVSVVPALVVAKRADAHGTRPVAAHYHVTLELEDGSRRESDVPGSTFGLVAEGDACIAVFRGELLAGLRVGSAASPPVDRPRARA